MGKGYGAGMGIKKKFDSIDPRNKKKSDGGNPSVFDAADKSKKNKKEKKSQMDEAGNY